MKKILGILIINIFISSSALTEEVVLNCKNNFFYFDDKGNDPSEFTETLIIDTKKKTFKHSKAKEDEILIIKDREFGSYWISNYTIGSNNRGYSAGVEYINRYDGERTSIKSKIPIDIGEKLNKLKDRGKNEQVYDQLRSFGTKYFKKNKDGWFAGWSCSKSKKMF